MEYEITKMQFLEGTIAKCLLVHFVTSNNPFDKIPVYLTNAIINKTILIFSLFRT